VHEAAVRLASVAGDAPRPMQLHLGQNLPFAPMASAFRRGAADIDPALDVPAGRQAQDPVIARMLMNRHPPYGVPGGVLQALRESGGAMYGVTSDEARRGQELFAAAEGCDIEPEAGVAVAALSQAVRGGRVGRNEEVLLNISGGGASRLKRGASIATLPPRTTLRAGCSDEELLAAAGAWSGPGVRGR
jgi:cysteate synthase